MWHHPQLPQDELTFRDISFFAIRRWRLLLVGALGLLLLGIMGWIGIPRQEEPRIDVPALSVVLAYPGASPEDVEAKVLRPVEEVLSGLSGVEYIEAIAIPNAATFAVKFEDSVAMDVAVEKVRGKVLGKRKDLPAEVKDPEVIHWGTSLTPQMVLALTGNVSEESLGREARRIKTLLSGVAGVSGIDLVGEFKPLVTVKLDPVRLARHGLSGEQVAMQLRLANVRIPGGEYDVGPFSTLLQVNQSFKGAQDVGEVSVGASGDPRGGTRTLRLRDVADVFEDSQKPATRFSYRGQPSVGLEVRFKSAEDAVAVGKAVHESLHRVADSLPKGMALRVAHDQPAWIQETVGGFVRSLVEGMVLVMLVITFGLGLRSAVVVAGVIPLTVGGTVLGLYLLGFSLDIVTIGGLIVSLGLLVDDAVVVTESVSILLGKGLGKMRAAVFGTARVFWANVGTSAVAIASFLPLFAMGGDTGLYIKGLPMAVVLAMITSSLVAQFFTPWVATLLMKRPKGVVEVSDEQPFARTDDRMYETDYPMAKKAGFAGLFGGGQGGRRARFSGSTDDSDASQRAQAVPPEQLGLEGNHQEHNPVLRAMKEAYVRIIPLVVAHPGKVVLGFTVVLAMSCTLFKVIGFEFFPKADKPVLFVGLELSRGSRLEHSSARMAEAIAILEKDEDVQDASGVAGESYPAIFVAHQGPGRGSHVADVLVRLRKGRDPLVVGERVRRSLSDLVGVKVKVEELSYGPPLSHPVLVRVYGQDYEVLKVQAEAIKGKLREISGAVNVRDSLSESLPLTRFELDSDRAFRTGLTPAQVGMALRTLHGRDKITDFRRGEDTVDVVIEPDIQPERPFGALEETTLQSATGHRTTLKDAGRAVLAHSPTRLNRRNSQRVVEVYADLAPGSLSSQVVDALDPWLKARSWPAGTSYGYAGEAEETAKSFRTLGVAAFGAVLLIFLLLLMMFDSLMLSVLVVIAVPYALIGALPGLALTGNAFGFMAFLGLIALIGVYVNHKIYYVDRVQELMRRGEDLPSAILHAGTDRLRPVVLTALTAVLGLVPLTLSGRMWGAFGWVNIFGLVASIPLSLILLPAFIVMADRITGRFRG